jgi:hypothetical protein
VASLSETNPYLRDKKKLEQMVAQSVYESSIFEGASPRALEELRKKAGLPPPRKRKPAKPK